MRIAPTSRRICSLSLLVLLAALASPLSAQEAPRRVFVADLADVIHPISAEYLVGTIAEAESEGADLIVLRLDTPGGLDSSMREIIQAMIGSSVPTCLFVAPSGARAASAGFFMAMAADVVAMAPGTNMGAASPVPVGGGEIDETMANKLLQDAEAYMRSLAEQRGRPADLAAEAVSDGRSFSATEAVEAGLADLLVSDLDELLTELSGRRIGDDVELPALADAELIRREPSLRQRILGVIANPQVAYMLMLLGIAGLYFELSSPGAVLPGVLGGLSLVLAALSFQILPIDFAGLALIALAVLFFILEVKIVSYGLLGIAGLVAFVLGSLMLFPGPIPELRLSPVFVIPTATAFVLIGGALVSLVVRAHRQRVTTGADGLVGEIGRTAAAIPPGERGKVHVHGEIWRARSDVALRAGDSVEVVDVESGMLLHVRPSSQKGN